MKFTSKNKEKDKITFEGELNGDSGTIDFTSRNYDEDKDVLKFNYDGTKGQMNMSAVNYETDNGTLNIGFDGQKGTIDLITKNWDSPTKNENNNETAYIKMDGKAKTINIQGYVSVTGSMSTTVTEIPD